MARTITYRTKTGPGAWQRAVVDEGALPQSITGLTNGTIYEVDTGKGTLVEVTPAVPPPDMTVTNIFRGRLHQANDNAQTVCTRTLDLSGYVAGDQIVVWVGAGDARPTLTLGDHTLQGVAASEVLHQASSTSGLQCNPVRFVLTGAGSGTASLSVTLTSTGAPICAIWGIKSGDVAFWQNAVFNSYPFTGTGPTPASATNIIIGTMIGRDVSNTQSAVWSNMTELTDAYYNGSGGNAWLSDARVENVAASPFLPTGSISVADRCGGGIMIVTPA